MNNSAASGRAGDTLGYLVLDITRLLSARFDGRARTLGITRAQWSLIAGLLRNEGATQAQLADIMQVTPMSVGRLVDRMAKAGWVERRIEPGDRRAYRLYLTEKAHAIRPALRRISQQTEAEALASLAPFEQSRLIEQLAGVRAALGALPPVAGGGRRGRG